MNKKEKATLKLNIANEEYIDENNELVFKKLVYNPLLRAMGLLVLLIFSLVNNERIMRLAALTSNAIFSSEVVLGHVTYYTILGVTIGLCLVISLASIIAKSNIDMSSIEILRFSYRFYSIYDMVIFILSTFVCLFFIIMILITPCNISGSSMENTYSDGDRVLLWNIGYTPADGDVIVFDSAKYVSNENSQSRFYIKRVVAKEGDFVEYRSNILYVNNQEVEKISLIEYYIIINSINVSNTNSFVVPDDKLLVMGDNRSISHDSRAIGFIDNSEVIGKVLFRFFPFNKIGNPEPDFK